MPYAFLITPFTPDRAGCEASDVFERVQRAVAAACAAAELRLVHPAKMLGAGPVMEQVRHQIEEADVLIAILTGQNPNVFYELGWSRRNAILIGQSASDFPFDVKAERRWTYGGPEELDTLATRLEEAIRQTLAEPVRERGERAAERFAALAKYPLPKRNRSVQSARSDDVGAGRPVRRSRRASAIYPP
jgi:hypothetical protein